MENLGAFTLVVSAAFAVILVGALLTVGVAVNQGVEDGINISSTDTYYDTLTQVQSDVQSNYGNTGLLLTIALFAAMIGMLFYFAAVKT